MSVSFCDCFKSKYGSLCKHQAAVVKFMSVINRNFVPVNNTLKQKQHTLYILCRYMIFPIFSKQRKYNRNLPIGTFFCPNYAKPYQTILLFKNTRIKAFPNCSGFLLIVVMKTAVVAWPQTTHITNIKPRHLQPMCTYRTLVKIRNLPQNV